MRNRLTCLLLLIILGLVLQASGQEECSAAKIVIDPFQKFQQIEGFGVNYTGPYFRDDQKAMFDKLIDDLGVTMFRVVPYLVYSNWEETPGAKDAEYWNDRYSTPIFEATWNGLRYGASAR